jgi:hypothetical protein
VKTGPRAPQCCRSAQERVGQGLASLPSQERRFSKAAGDFGGPLCVRKCGKAAASCTATWESSGFAGRVLEPEAQTPLRLTPIASGRGGDPPRTSRRTSTSRSLPPTGLPRALPGYSSDPS